MRVYIILCVGIICFSLIGLFGIKYKTTKIYEWAKSKNYTVLVIEKPISSGQFDYSSYKVQVKSDNGEIKFLYVRVGLFGIEVEEYTMIKYMSF